MEQAQTKLSSDDWLEAALDALYDNGAADVKVERLARRLGVTKGSFYWHFRDQRQLYEEMIAHWKSQQLVVIGVLQDSSIDAPDKLEILYRHIASKNARHDVAMRVWARTDPAAKAAVAFLDRSRIKTVAAIYEGLGASRELAEFCAHAVYNFQIGDQFVLDKRNAAAKAQRFEQLKELLSAYIAEQDQGAGR